MVAVRSNAGEMVNRASFTGKDMTFIEVIFGANVTATATTPDEAGASQFEEVAKIIQGTANSSGATIIAHFGGKYDVSAIGGGRHGKKDFSANGHVL